MTVQFNYKTQNGKDVVKTLKPFKLESEPICYCCSGKLTAEEKEQKSKFTYYDASGNMLGTVETYVCFACIDKLMER